MTVISVANELLNPTSPTPSKPLVTFWLQHELRYHSPINQTNSPVAKGGEKEKQTETAVKVHRIRITLTSRHVKNVEKGSSPTSYCEKLIV